MSTDDQKSFYVGPVLLTGEICDAVVEALEIDNPEKMFKIEDRHAYMRVQTENECIVRRETVEEILGRPFSMQELETILGSFAGQIEGTESYVRFYFDHKSR